jgi:hypothetical protein
MELEVKEKKEMCLTLSSINITQLNIISEVKEIFSLD